MNFDPTNLSNFMLILVTWGALFLAALWLSLIIWTYRDIRARARDPLGRILAVLVVAVLFLPGIVVYLILRPRHTLEDEYQRTLEEEALLQSIEETPVCPGCSRRTQPLWMVCPNCHTKLKKPCHHCGKLMELPWNLCPYCSTPTPGMRRENLSLDDALKSLSPAPLDDFESDLELDALSDEPSIFEETTESEEDLQPEEELQDE